MIISEQEFEDDVHEFINPDDWCETDDELMQALGYLALMSGRLPHEIFEDPEWPKNILFDMKVSNLTFRSILDVLKLRS